MRRRSLRPKCWGLNGLPIPTSAGRSAYSRPIGQPSAAFRRTVLCLVLLWPLQAGALARAATVMFTVVVDGDDRMTYVL